MHVLEVFSNMQLAMYGILGKDNRYYIFPSRKDFDLRPFTLIDNILVLIFLYSCEVL